MSQDIQPAIMIPDRDELPSLMEPLLLAETSRHRRSTRSPALTDLALELARKSSGFRRSLPNSIVSSLADLVRSINCYYSNLIEGHNTHPVDIERALRNDYSHDRAKRDLQLEATAHVEVQKWIDHGGLPGHQALTVEGMREIHRRFCSRLPEDLRWIGDTAAGPPVPLIPGEFRRRDVQVGRLVPVSPGAVPRFLARFEAVYTKLGTTETILATAAAHHRLLWIHPFADGNGRVARLVSHAILLNTLETGAAWSVARGLARNAQEYKTLLARCDMTRRNDPDGCGTLSEEALAEFTRFLLTVSIDQVDFMESLVQPDRLRTRILLWAEEEIRFGALPPKSGMILEAVLYRGELPRGDAAAVVGLSERHARRIVSALTERGILTAESTRAPLRLVFPATLAARWMPGLFPEQAS